MERDKKSTKTRDCEPQEGQFEESRRSNMFLTANALKAFSAEMLREEVCQGWIFKKLHPAGARCPGCNSLLQDTTTIANFWQGKRCVCKCCGRWFTAISGTFLQGGNLTMKQIYLLAFLLNFTPRGIDINGIAHNVGVSANTVRLWIKKFKFAEVVENERE